MPMDFPSSNMVKGEKMKVSAEVVKTIDALKKAGFTPVDAVFEGAVGVKEDATLEFMDKLNDGQLVTGVIRVIYTVGEDQVRFVEIPVGQQQPPEEGMPEGGR
ncbi:hypothetical protein HY995_03485 [Candidatus Micrarchaeota archaeon]|nr:hypothetical protein [Candidatus Micrarchaeota archaeon]MBI5177122.1 hypothetical protein [Candidatus Micrarchaeota archaeon]